MRDAVATWVCTGQLPVQGGAGVKKRKGQAAGRGAGGQPSHAAMFRRGTPNRLRILCVDLAFQVTMKVYSLRQGGKTYFVSQFISSIVT